MAYLVPSLLLHNPPAVITNARSTCREELVEGRFVDGHHGDSAAVPLGQRVGGIMSRSHANSLCQNLLQLRCRSSSDHRPYQRQSVVVEVSLYV